MASHADPRQGGYQHSAPTPCLATETPVFNKNGAAPTSALGLESRVTKGLDFLGWPTPASHCPSSRMSDCALSSARCTRGAQW